MKTIREDRLIWLDLETGGLSPTQDPILELGIVITDNTGEPLDECNWVVRPMKRSAWDHSRYEHVSADAVRAGAAPVVQEMHDKSGLWADCLDSNQTLFDVGNQLPDYLAMNGFDLKTEQLIIAGNGIDRFDRLFLETNAVPLKNFHMLFHYRSVDISNLYHTARYMGIDLNEKREPMVTPHRAVPDCYKSAFDYRWYRIQLRAALFSVGYSKTHAES